MSYNVQQGRPKINNAQLVREYLAGASTLTLGRKYDRCHTAIMYRLRRQGVTLRAPGAPRGNTNRHKIWQSSFLGELGLA